MKLTGASLVPIFLVLCSMPIYADSVSTVDVSASSGPCVLAPDSCGLVPVTIVAQFTTMLETGEFYSTTLDHLIYGTEPVVVGITGLLDGLYPMSFVPAPALDGWMLYGLAQDVRFSADGSNWEIENDGEYTVVANIGDGSETLSVTWVNWSAVQVPEPTSFALLAVGLIGLASRRLWGA